jgi:ATP-binding cassette subfamily C protein LapB
VPVVLLRKFSSGLGWSDWPRSAGRTRGLGIRFVSISHGQRVLEPTVPIAVIFASFAINLLALALPLSIMQVYDRIIPNRSLATLAYLFLGLSLAIAVDYVLKTSRSALLSWHATQFVAKVEHEGVSTLFASSQRDI